MRTSIAEAAPDSAGHDRWTIQSANEIARVRSGDKPAGCDAEPTTVPSRPRQSRSVPETAETPPFPVPGTTTDPQTMVQKMMVLFGEAPASADAHTETRPEIKPQL